MSTHSHTLFSISFLLKHLVTEKHSKKKAVVPTVGIILHNSKNGGGVRRIGGRESTTVVIFLSVGLFAFLFFFLQIRSEYIYHPLFCDTVHRQLTIDS